MISHDENSQSLDLDDADKAHVIEPCAVLANPNQPTSMPQQQAKDEESTAEEITKHTIEEAAVVQCSLCNSKDVVFSRRTEFLRHICVDHFKEEHLVNFPEFLPDEIFQQAMKLTN